MDKNEFYKQEFFRYESHAKDQGEKLDRIILLISAGALVLSVNYIIGSRATHFTDTWLLITAWAVFIFSIILQAIAYLFSRDAFDGMVKALNVWANSATNEPFTAPAFLQEKGDQAMRLTDWSLGTMIIGLLTIAAFAIVNLS